MSDKDRSTKDITNETEIFEVPKSEGKEEGNDNITEPEESEEKSNEIIEEEASLVLDTEDFISQPVITEGFSKKEGFIEFNHSFGYDCQQYFNLCVADEEALIFLSGNLINIFHIESKTLYFRRSAGGGGLGHITKNPKHPHIAIGEKGVNPLLIVYEWPSFDIVCILRDGTTHAYTHLSYSPDGTMLCSQGGEPDFLITIWDWEKSHIILRNKSHGQDVVNAEFSLYVPGQLVSSGLGHIKFWKMAQTFTGLKLQGELGRFGKTEICDIVGIFAMPDEKVLSGSEWGNILVWEAGLIKLEVRQRGQRTCHAGAISQIHYCNVTNQVTTVGMDGWIKIWTYSVIELADPPEDDRFVEMNPLFEIQLKDNAGSAKLRSIVKKNDSLDDFDWFAQDANGGIFYVSLNPSDPVQHIERLFNCHPGVVVAIATSPSANYLATLGGEGCLKVYNTVMKTLIMQRQFCAGGTCLLWLPPYVEATGTVLVGGFSDGQLRVIVVSAYEKERFNEKDVEYVNIIQISKPHNSAVNTISLNSRGTTLVTGGEDTVFIYQIQARPRYVMLQPTGFIDVPGPVSCIIWKPNHSTTALIGCWNGFFMEVTFPERKSLFSAVSYKLELHSKVNRFVSVKSEILRAILVEEIETRKQGNLEKRKQELAKVKAENPGLDIDEELFLAELEEEEEPLPPLYYPEVPAPILFAKYTPEGTIWLSPGGYDAGYIYEYVFEEPRPVRCTNIPGAEDIEIHSYLEVYHGEYLALGFANGKVRLVQINKDCHFDLSEYWELPMHDNDNGIIKQLALNYNGDFLFTCGSDGNVFSFLIEKTAEELKKSMRKSITVKFGIPSQTVPDIDGTTQLSLEETKQKVEDEKQLHIANLKKEKVLGFIQNLKAVFKNIIIWNQRLPTSQKLPPTDFELDQRITEHIQDLIGVEDELLERQTAFIMAKSRLRLKKIKDYFLDPVKTLTVTVKGISKNCEVKTFVHKKLSDYFHQAESEACKRSGKLSQDETTTTGSGLFRSSLISTIGGRAGNLDSFVSRFSPLYPKLNIRVIRLIERLKLLKAAQEFRQKEWQYFKEIKPDIKVNDPEDVKALEEAKQTIGDFKLKTDDDYVVPEHLRVTTVNKYKDLLKIHREIYETKHQFNKKVLNLRKNKIFLASKIKQMLHDLQIIQSELAEGNRKELPKLEQLNIDHDFPENAFKISDIKDYSAYVPLTNPYNEEVHVLKVDNLNPVSLDAKERFKFGSMFITLDLENFAKDDNQDTPWELEMKSIRMMRQLYEQDNIYRDLKSSIENFDQNIEQLGIERLQVAIKVKYLELHYLTAYQEFIIIESYSSLEDTIFSKVTQSTSDKEEKLGQMAHVQYQIDMKMEEITDWENRLAELQKEFSEMVSGNKFATFLSRIFKKKVKVQRRSSYSESDSESSSSDEDDDEEDDDDDESPDYLPIRLDENVCPTGCDPALFEATFKMRGEKYNMEESIVDLKKQTEGLQKEMDNNNKQLRVLEGTLQRDQLELKIVQLEKQKKLNAVEGLPILELSQLQHFQESHKMQLLAQSLLFPTDMLTKLQCRVRELEEEMRLQKMKYKKHQKYRRRLEKESLNFVSKRETLKDAIVETKVRRFGKVVDDIMMEEKVLRKMILEARTTILLGQLRRDMDFRVYQAKELVMVKSEELASHIKENTKKIKLLTMLTEENCNLMELLNDQSFLKDKHISEKSRLEDYTESVEKLEAALRQEILDREECLREIERLKLTKGACHSRSAGDAPLPMLTSPIPKEEEKVEEIDILPDLFFERVRSVANKLIDDVLIRVTGDVENLLEIAGTRSAAKVHRFVTGLVEEVVAKAVKKFEVLEEEEEVEVISAEAISAQPTLVEARSSVEIILDIVEDVVRRASETVQSETGSVVQPDVEKVETEEETVEAEVIVGAIIEDLLPDSVFESERTEVEMKKSLENFASKIVDEIATKASFIVRENLLKINTDSFPTVQYPEEIELKTSGERITHELLDGILSDVSNMFEILVGSMPSTEEETNLEGSSPED